MAAFMAGAQGRVRPALDAAGASASPAQRVALPPAAAPTLGEAREKFLPLTRYALIDRLAAPNLWGQGEAAEARRFFRYLDFWRHQTYVARLLELEQTYEPFSPDSDLLITRKFTGEERITMQKELVGQVRTLLENANFTEIAASQVEILSQGSTYGLELQCDLSVFDEIAIFYRGSSMRTDVRTTLLKASKSKRALGVNG